jgi:MYXO-CTERM domain-containing protein
MIHHTRCTIAIAIAVAAACLLASSSVARAGTVYEVNTTGATEIGSKNNDVYIGQSFNSGTNTLLTSASLQINRNELAIADFTLNLRLAAGTPLNFLATGAALASGTFSNSILSETLQTFYEFTGLNWPLSPNTVYMIGIDSEASPSVKWTLNQSIPRESSTGFITGYGGYNAQRNNVVDDGLHGATITAVPEPAMAVVAVAALGGLLVHRRRRPRA